MTNALTQSLSLGCALALSRESGSLDGDQLPGLLSNMLLSAIPLMELRRSVADLEVSRSLERVFRWQLFFRILLLFRTDLTLKCLDRIQASSRPGKDV